MCVTHDSQLLKNVTLLLWLRTRLFTRVMKPAKLLKPHPTQWTAGYLHMSLLRPREETINTDAREPMQEELPALVPGSLSLTS